MCRPPPGGVADMNAWWWVGVGLLAWFSVSLAAGLLLGRLFGRSAQARDALDAQEWETPAEHQEPPEDGAASGLETGQLLQRCRHLSAM